MLSCKANDAFAVVKITAKDDSEEIYENILQFLITLLEYGFPKSYSIKFTSPKKEYIQIKGIHKKGVNQLFNNASCYKRLWPLIEKYKVLFEEYKWDNVQYR